MDSYQVSGPRTQLSLSLSPSLTHSPSHPLPLISSEAYKYGSATPVSYSTARLTLSCATRCSEVQVENENSRAYAYAGYACYGRTHYTVCMWKELISSSTTLVRYKSKKMVIAVYA